MFTESKEISDQIKSIFDTQNKNKTFFNFYPNISISVSLWASVSCVYGGFFRTNAGYVCFCANVSAFIDELKW